MLRRRENWPQLLREYLAAHEGDEFRYGVWDCCLFVCGAVDAMTGVDPAASFRDRYRTRHEAHQALRERVGKVSLRRVVESVTFECGMPRVPVLMAQRGDVILVRRAAGRCSLGMMALNGRNILVLSSLGMQSAPLEMALAAWRV